MRIGKLPSSRIRHTVWLPRRSEKNALSSVLSASRCRLGRTMSPIGNCAAATEAITWNSGPRLQVFVVG